MKPAFSLLLTCCLLAPAAHAADEVASAPASAVASAPAAVAIPGKEDVKKAIAILETNFLGEEAGVAAETVMLFAQESKDISIQLNPKTTPWIFGEAKTTDKDEEIYRRMLMVAYLAGNVKAQLTTGKAVDSPVAGWGFALKSYQAIQKANGKIKLAELETLKKQQAKGELPGLAKKALQK